MNKDALWALLVVILLTSMAAMMLDRDGATTSESDVQPEQQETNDAVQNETVSEPPHDDGHLHPAPILSLISAEDDGSMITLSGYAIHGHPDQVLVDVLYLNESIVQFTPDASGLWNLTLNTEDSGTISLNFTAIHTIENTTSEPMVVDIDRTEEEQEPVGEGEGNEAEGNASNGQRYR